MMKKKNPPTKAPFLCQRVSLVFRGRCRNPWLRCFPIFCHFNEVGPRRYEKTGVDIFIFHCGKFWSGKRVPSPPLSWIRHIRIWQIVIQSAASVVTERFLKKDATILWLIMIVSKMSSSSKNTILRKTHFTFSNRYLMKMFACFLLLYPGTGCKKTERY